MKSSNWKRLLLIGFIVILFVAIPVTLYELKQQQNTRSHANPATTLSFTPTSSQAAPITDAVGDQIPVQVAIDPSTNLVTAVKLYIQYDPTKLSATSSAFTINTQSFPETVDGPNYSSGLITASVSVGTDLTNAVQAPTTVGTINFTALAPTDPNNPTQVTITTQSEVLSGGPNDQASENVLLPQSPPAFIAITGAAISPTVTGTPTITPTPIPGVTSVPTSTPTITPTPAPGVTSVPTDTPTPGIQPTAVPTDIVVEQPTFTPSPTIAQTGSTDVTFSVAAILTVVTVVGGIILFVL